tara:strand:+ start:1211 stop:1978 length:768 start_codon:yes stop_codon:yes gene_type:complete
MLDYFAIFLSCGIFVFVTEKYRTGALFFTLCIAVLFLLIQNSEKWNLFYLVKTYSVIIPIIILSITQSRFYHDVGWIRNLHDYIPNLIKLFFIINILEGSLLLFHLKQYIIGLGGLVLIITMPRFSLNDSQNFGFENIVWVMSYVFCFVVGVILYPLPTDFKYPIFVALTIPIIFCYILKDWSKWFSFRVYSIYFILVLDVFFSNGNFSIYDSVGGFLGLKNNHINVNSGYFLQFIVIVFSGYLVKKRWTNNPEN